MSTTLEGIVENGQIRLLHGIALPENAKVYVVVPDTEPLPFARIPSPRLVHPEQTREFTKEVIEVANDAEI